MFESKYLTKIGKILGACAFSAMLGSSTIASAQTPLSIPEDYEARTLEAQFVANGPTLLFSDSPEMVYRTGILYRDTVQGQVRLFFHHVNAVPGNKKLVVLLKNEKLRPVQYKLVRSGQGGHTYNWMGDGKEAQRQYFSDAEQRQLEGKLGFGQYVELLTGKGDILKQDELLTGTLDLELSAPTQLTVFMCEPQSDILLFNDNAPIQPMDEHPLRGTFKNADWNYAVKKPIDGKEAVKLKLAGSEEGYIKGVDATTGLPAENYGNYGVNYRVDFTVKSKQPVSLILNPIGGSYAGYGVLEYEGKRQLLALPDYAVSLGETIEEAVELAQLKSGKYSFIWSPPGASNLPVELIWRSTRNPKS